MLESCSRACYSVSFYRAALAALVVLAGACGAPGRSAPARIERESVPTGASLVVHRVYVAAFDAIESALEADDLEGLLHISELTEDREAKPEDILQPGQKVEVRIIRVDIEERKIGLSFVHSDFAENENLPAPTPAAEEGASEGGEAPAAEAPAAEAPAAEAPAEEAPAAEAPTADAPAEDPKTDGSAE